MRSRFASLLLFVVASCDVSPDPLVGTREDAASPDRVSVGPLGEGWHDGRTVPSDAGVPMPDDAAVRIPIDAPQAPPYDALPLPTDDAGPVPPVDAGLPDAWQPPLDDFQYLSQTGLYQDIEGEQLSAGLLEYTPRYPLWSDGTVKRRWLWLPPGTQIDTSDMDFWSFPVGARLWKEFAFETGDGLVRIETRLIERRGPAPDDVWMGSFVWNDAQTEALGDPS